mgnify:CR=1 FL=1
MLDGLLIIRSPRLVVREGQFSDWAALSEGAARDAALRALPTVVPPEATEIHYYIRPYLPYLEASFSLSEEEFARWSEQMGWRPRPIEYPTQANALVPELHPATSVETGLAWQHSGPSPNDPWQLPGLASVLYDSGRRRVYYCFIGDD